jgi:hypothetical protein
MLVKRVKFIKLLCHVGEVVVENHHSSWMKVSAED